jgi:8-oxo-dGTP diphosphatase
MEPPVPASPIRSPALARRPVRLAVRAVIMDDGRLLMVNAWRDPARDLWCAPGGGVEPGTSLPANLIREVAEETGLTIEVGAPCLVNEFHDPAGDFHQCDIYFRARVTAGRLDPGWRDPAGVVSRRRFVTRAELAGLRHKPDSLAAVAWGEGLLYDPLEPILR